MNTGTLCFFFLQNRKKDQIAETVGRKSVDKYNYIFFHLLKSSPLKNETDFGNPREEKD